MGESKVVAQKVHARLGASSSARWIACPGSVRLSEGIPNYPTDYTREGTAAHAVAELSLRKRVDCATFVGTLVEADGEHVEVTEEMADAVQIFVDYCRAQWDRAQKAWIEHRFNLAPLNPPEPMYGTADFVAFKDGVLEVVDLKYGQGVVVEAKENEQLMYYALGAALSLGTEVDIQEVKITIVQPRAPHPDGVVRSVHVEYFDLLDFAGLLMEAAGATQDPAAPLVPGEHCRFCPALGNCPALRKKVEALAQVEFSAMPLDVPPEPESLPPEAFADILTKLDILEDWAAAMRATALRRLEAGEAVPGFKLVAKRATRKWKDEAEVEQWLKAQGHDDAEIFTKKLRSPAQAEKLVGKKNLPVEFWEAISSGNTLAPESDKRPAISAGSEFDALPPSSTQHNVGASQETK